MGVSAGVGEESDEHLLCRRAALEAHGGHHGWPAQKLLVSCVLPSLCARASSSCGERIRWEVGVGAGNWEEEASELRLFRQAVPEVAANAKASPPNLAFLYSIPSYSTAADGGTATTVRVLPSV